MTIWPQETFVQEHRLHWVWLPNHIMNYSFSFLGPQDMLEVNLQRFFPPPFLVRLSNATMNGMVSIFESHGKKGLKVLIQTTSVAKFVHFLQIFWSAVNMDLFKHHKCKSPSLILKRIPFSASTSQELIFAHTPPFLYNGSKKKQIVVTILLPSNAL